MSARVAVVGSLNMDLVVHVERLPAPGETVAGSAVEVRDGGKGANQAVAAAALGAQVRLVGAVGTDTYGAALVDGTRDRGVDVDHVESVDGPSGMAFIAVDPVGQNTITMSPGANARLEAHAAVAALGELAGYRIAMMQLEIPTAVNLAVARRAREIGVRTMLNAAPLGDPEDPELKELLGLCDTLVVNETEAAQLLGYTPRNWGDAAGELISLGPAAAVITCGADGALAYDGQQLVTQPGFEVDAVDGTGAGDTFCGALAVALTAGQDWGQSLAYACAAGAIACTRLGGQAGPTPADIAHLLDQQGGSRAS
jgi:ribokinase